MWHGGLGMQCGPGNVEAASLVHRRSTVGPGGCKGEHEMAEILQMGMIAPVHPWQPLSLI
jgi:hypothetical protein